jgi:hypothetical protein
MEPVDIPPSKAMPRRVKNRRMEERMTTADLIVVGPPSSGTRLAQRLMAESGLDTLHDRSHGVTDAPLLKVVCIYRDRDARIASVLARDDMPMFANITTQEQAETFVDGTEATVADKYPTRPALSYEALIADRDAELDRIADELGIPHWSSTILVTNQNAKHLGGS